MWNTDWKRTIFLFLLYYFYIYFSSSVFSEINGTWRVTEENLFIVYRLLLTQIRFRTPPPTLHYPTLLYPCVCDERHRSAWEWSRNLSHRLYTVHNRSLVWIGLPSFHAATECLWLIGSLPVVWDQSEKDSSHFSYTSRGL